MNNDHYHSYHYLLSQTKRRRDKHVEKCEIV